MNGNVRRLLPWLVAALFAAGAGGGVMAVTSEGQGDCTATRGQADSFEAVRFFVEYNATDNDLGVQGSFDAEAYAELCVYDPNGSLILDIKPQGSLQDLMLSGVFFESREPQFSEFSFDDLASMFPEGNYTIVGVTTDGESLEGVAIFTHAIPAAPNVIAPRLAQSEDQADEAAVPAGGLTIEWGEVTQTVSGDAATITGYEVTITNVDKEDPNGFSQPTFDVHVPPDRRSLTVSPEFLEPDTVYELEVLALEKSGNQTITSGFFATEKR